LINLENISQQSSAIRKYLSEIDFFENYKIDNIGFRYVMSEVCKHIFENQIIE